MKYYVVIPKVWSKRDNSVIQIGKLYRINDNGPYDTYTDEDGSPGLVYPLVCDEHVFDEDFFN